MEESRIRLRKEMKSHTKELVRKEDIDNLRMKTGSNGWTSLYSLKDFTFEKILFEASHYILLGPLKKLSKHILEILPADRKQLLDELTNIIPQAEQVPIKDTSTQLKSFT